MENISDTIYTIAKDLYEDADFKLTRNGEVESISVADYDDYNGYYNDCSIEDFNAAKQYVEDLVSKVKYYDGKIELNDNHTLRDVHIPDGKQFYDDEYAVLYQMALQNMEDEIGTEVYGLGRSGRHICVDDTFNNLCDYDKLKEVQRKWEQWLIDELNGELSNADDGITESLSKDEFKVKCLTCGNDISYTKRDVEKDLDGDFITCPSCKSSIMLESDNQTEEGKLVDSISEYLNKNEVYAEVDVDEDGDVQLDIAWGDWKHDHLRADNLMEQLGYELVGEDVTEDDGSDCYSAIRTYKKSNKVVTEQDNKFRNGDKVKIDYISDANEHNGKVGTLSNMRKYKYYPNGKEDEFEYRHQGVIKYDDGTEEKVSDLYRKGSGIVSPVDLVESKSIKKESMSDWESFVDSMAEDDYASGQILSTDDFDEFKHILKDEDVNLSDEEYEDAFNYYFECIDKYKGYGKVKESVTEYTITFTEGDDFITEDKDEADARFEELKQSSEFENIEQYYAKTWVFDFDSDEYIEDDVEVYYTKGDLMTESVNDLKIAIAKKRTDDMIKAVGNDVTDMDKQIMYKNTLNSLDDIKSIDTILKDYECDNSNRSVRMVQDLKDLKNKLSKKTESEDLNQVKADIEDALNNTESTEQEIEQVKGSIDVLKTDEESAIEGYEDFQKETDKVADKELADAVNDQMQEIVDDEKEHIEKLDAVKDTLDESKSSGVSEDVKLTKDNKDTLEVGDILADSSNRYVIVDIADNQDSKSITVRDEKDWRPIYSTSITKWYGTTIIKGPFVRQDGKVVKTESLSDSFDLEQLANDIVNWYSNDMGTWFDEIQGQEEEVYNDTLDVLESKDIATIQSIIEDMEDYISAINDKDDADRLGTIGIVDKLKELLPKDTLQEDVNTNKALELKSELVKLNDKSYGKNALISRINKIYEKVFGTEAPFNWYKFDEDSLVIDINDEDAEEDTQVFSGPFDIDGFDNEFEISADYSKPNYVELRDADSGDEYMVETKVIREDLAPTIKESLNTGVLPIVDVDMYSIISSGMIDEYDIPDDGMESLDEIVKEVAPKYIKETLNEVLPSAEIQVTGVYHPKQYNFSGDELEFELVANGNEYNELKEKVIADASFEQFLKDNYSSRSGFVSSMPDSLNEFNQAPEWKQLVQVIMFALKDTDLKSVNDAYLEEFFEKLGQEFPYIENDLEESKKVEESKDDTIGEIQEDGTVVKKYYRQGYVYKNFDNFDNKSGPCYISEYQGEDYIDEKGNSKTKNFNDMVEGEDYETYDTIIKQVRDGYKERGMDVSEQTIEDTAELVFDDVDWQTIDSRLQEILDSEEELAELGESKKIEDKELLNEDAVKEWWVGDPCYVLSDDIYDDIWGKKYDYKDGLIDCENGLSFDVHGTAYGDGSYKGSNGFWYAVDSGTLAVIPKELVSKEDGIGFGTFHKSTNGEIEYEDGVFHIEFDNEILDIDTDPTDDDLGLSESKILKNKGVNE